MYRGKIQGTEKKVLVGPREARGIFEMIDTKIQVLMKNLNQEGIISQTSILFGGFKKKKNTFSMLRAKDSKWLRGV